MAEVEEKRARAPDNEDSRGSKKVKVKGAAFQLTRPFQVVMPPRPAAPQRPAVPATATKSFTEPKKAEEKFWQTLRGALDLDKLLDKVLDMPVPDIHVHDILALFPDLVSKWFSIKL